MKAQARARQSPLLFPAHRRGKDDVHTKHVLSELEIGTNKRSDITIWSLHGITENNGELASYAFHRGLYADESRNPLLRKSASML